MLGGFERLEFSGERSLAGAVEEGGDLGVGEGLEGAGGGESLVEDGHGVDAGDDDGDGEGEAVVEGLDGLDGVAFEDEGVAEGLHGEDADALLESDGDDVVGEGAEVGVHNVDGHLYGVEVDAVLVGHVDHAEVDDGVFVTGEADVAEFACLLGGESGFHGSARGEDAVGVFHADDLVELDEVDHVGLESAEGLFELAVECGGGASVDFGHEEDLGAVAVAEGLAHADFADAVVVVPAVVHEGDAVVDGFVDEGDAVLGVGLASDVVSAEADGGDFFSGGTEVAVEHVGRLGAGDSGRGWRLGGGREVGRGGGDAGGGGGFEEVSAFHGSLRWWVLDILDAGVAVGVSGWRRGR